MGLLWPRVCASPWAPLAEHSADCGMFLLLFVQSNKQKNNKTPTLPSMLLCRSLEGQDGPLICSARGDEPAPEGSLVLLRYFGCQGSPGHPVCQQLRP